MYAGSHLRGDIDVAGQEGGHKHLFIGSERECVCEGAPSMCLCECVFLFVCVGNAAEGPTEAPNCKVRPFHFRSNGCHLKPEAF